MLGRISRILGVVIMKRFLLAASLLVAPTALVLSLSGTAGADEPAAPTVSPTSVVAGGSIAISGTGCTAVGGQAVQAEFGIIDGAQNLITADSVVPQDATTGAWSGSLTVPAGTAAGSYQVVSDCDQYSTGFDYPAVSLTVIATGSATASPATVAPGGSVTVSGGGFTPGESVAVVLHSDPVTLATLTANAQGVASGAVTIPTTTALGAHTIVLTGSTSGVVDSVALSVVAATGPTANPSNTGTLAVTGAPVGYTLLAGLVLIAAGLSLVLTTRRWYNNAAHARRG